MEREREERAGETTSFFIFLPSEVEREREGRGQGKEGRRKKRGPRKGSEGTNSYGPPFVPQSAAERRPGAFRTPWSGMEPWNAAVRRAAVQVTQQMEPKKG